MVLVDPPIGAKGAGLPNLQALLKEWGIDARQQRRRRRQRRHQRAEHRGGGQLSPRIAITDRFAHADGLSARALDRRRSSGGVNGRSRAAARRDQLSGAGRKPNLAIADERQAGVAMEPDKGDKAGPVDDRAPPYRRPSEAPAPAASQRRRPAADAPKPETRVVVFGDSDFASNAYGGVRWQPEPVRERRELAGAAGEPDCDPADAGRRPPRDDDGAAADDGVPDLDLPDAGRGVRRRASITWWRRR